MDVKIENLLDYLNRSRKKYRYERNYSYYYLPKINMLNFHLTSGGYLQVYCRSKSSLDWNQIEVIDSKLESPGKLVEFNEIIYVLGNKYGYLKLEVL